MRTACQQLATITQNLYTHSKNYEPTKKFQINLSKAKLPRYKQTWLPGQICLQRQMFPQVLRVLVVFLSCVCLCENCPYIALNDIVLPISFCQDFGSTASWKVCNGNGDVDDVTFFSFCGKLCLVTTIQNTPKKKTN